MPAAHAAVVRTRPRGIIHREAFMGRAARCVAVVVLWSLCVVSTAMAETPFERPADPAAGRLARTVRGVSVRASMLGVGIIAYDILRGKKWVRSAVQFAGGAAGAAFGGMACGSETLVTFGMAAGSCFVLVPGGAIAGSTAAGAGFDLVAKR